MGHKWIIDVLADLEAFALHNDLPSLAGELRKTAFVASAEIAAMDAKAPTGMQVDVDADRVQPVFSRSVSGGSF